jgi:trans-aconitate methyltransferase
MVRRAWWNLRFLLAGNERYYPASRWEKSYLDGYSLEADDQDARYGALTALMERYDQGRGILDLGCGGGLLEQKYQRLSKSPMLGVDYSQEAVKQAIAKGLPNCQFLCSDYRKCEVHGPFDMVIFNESLYYIDDVGGTLHGLLPALASNGVMIVSMYESFPNRRIWKSLLRQCRTLRSVLVSDATHEKQWQIRVLQWEPTRSS